MKLEARIKQLAGVVTVGIFVHRLAGMLMLGREAGPMVMEP